MSSVYLFTFSPPFSCPVLWVHYSVEGTLALHAYTGRDGQQRQSLEVRARDMQMLDKAGERGAIFAPALDPTNIDAPPNSDDVPF